MDLRAPSVPLITVDPYFSVWSPANKLTDTDVVHWTSKEQAIKGIVTIDGVDYRFMGTGEEPALPQIDLEIEAFTTRYTFEGAGVRIFVEFMTACLPDDMEWISRPTSYMAAGQQSIDGKEHTVALTLTVPETICLNEAGQKEVKCEPITIAEDIPCYRIGAVEQNPLNCSGDDVRIDWGYFYLSATGADAKVCEGKSGEMSALVASVNLTDAEDALFVFAYDDVYSLEYFGEKLKAYWVELDGNIETAIEKAYAAYEDLYERCMAFSDRLFVDATRAGGEHYAELLMLALRQVMAAHKLAKDPKGEFIYISKECFSNGCAATVDVSYPSIPMYLIYNPELVKAMMRPIYEYANGDVWPFDFAPHDAGRYPLVNGQVYSKGTDPERQMPVEECGNMLVMMAAVAIAEQNTDFSAEHLENLKQWAKYLLEYGMDPGNQLCTDDFAGKLAHNCNLSLKAIMGLEGLSIIMEMLGEAKDADFYHTEAQKMADHWVETADNGDGSFRLAFDSEGTFSMKYNMVWDILWNTSLFSRTVINSELASYQKKMMPYGLPLDNRMPYTKSDWLVWTATMADNKEEFKSFIEPMWLAFHSTPTRVPMTDLYFTDNSLPRVSKTLGTCFQHRTVQGGLFIKLLDYYKMQKIK